MTGMTTRMPRWVPATAATALVACGAAAAVPAAADWYLNESYAEHLIRGNLHSNLGYHYTAAFCRPQGRSAPEPGYVYHRWTCMWVAGDSPSSPDCRGATVVVGSHSGRGRYYTIKLFSRGECQYGTP